MAIKQSAAHRRLDKKISKLWQDVDDKYFMIPKQKDLTIYHYTNLGAALSIIKSRSLHASDVRYLNDSREIEYGDSIFKHVLNRFERAAEMTGDTKKSEIIKMIKDFYGTDLQPSYATCFCLDGDLLSQWRGYGQKVGVSIGFSAEILNNSDFNLSKVIYDVKEQSQIIEEILQNVISFVSAARSKLTFEELMDSVSGTTGPISSFIVPLKDQAFSEEKEYRLYLSNYERLSRLKINYQATTNFITGYIICELSPAEWKKAVREIVVGPGSAPELRIKNFKEVLHSLGLANVLVRSSEAPYRS